MSQPQMGQWIGQNLGNPGGISSAANTYGLGGQDVASLYNQYYGTNYTGDQANSYLAGPQANTFNIPTNLFPYSQSSSSGSGSSSASSGIDWSKSPVSFAEMQAQAAALPQLAQDVGTTSYNRYAKMLRDALGDKANFAGVFNNMGSRNMSGSSVASDAYGNAMMGITKDIGDKAYASDVQALMARMSVPQVMAQIAGLGHVSQSQGSSGSSGSSYQANPLAPYELIANMINSGY
jgi:hypothetical protein